MALFNGKDLTGWATDVPKADKEPGIAPSFIVRDEMLISLGKPYPRNWGLTKPDKNIDHRRVPNLQFFFKRQSYQLTLAKANDPAKFLPGDLVTCTVPPHLPHIMIVSNRKNAAGVPLVIHNIGGGVQEEDSLFKFPLTGHYRVK